VRYFSSLHALASNQSISLFFGPYDPVYLTGQKTSKKKEPVSNRKKLLAGSDFLLLYFIN